MMENEGERKSMRNNLLERRRLQLELASYEAAKRNVAIDMRKSQTEMRRRLQRYKNRLKEISRDRDDSRIISIEQFLERHKRKKKINVLSPRPHSSPLVRRMSKFSGNTLHADEESVNPELFGSRRKSKVDLRPFTACTSTIRHTSPEVYKRARSGVSICKDPEAQIRYFVEDEIQDRASFYKHILEIRKNFQREISNSLRYRVAEFCGNPKDDSGYITPSENKEEKETWRPLGTDMADLKQEIKLFTPRIKLPLQPERSKKLFRKENSASGRINRIPNVVIEDTSGQKTSKNNVRPATAGVPREVKYPQKDYLRPSEF